MEEESYKMITKVSCAGYTNMYLYVHRLKMPSWISLHVAC